MSNFSHKCKQCPICGYLPAHILTINHIETTHMPIDEFNTKYPGYFQEVKFKKNIKEFKCKNKYIVTKNEKIIFDGTYKMFEQKFRKEPPKQVPNTTIKWMYGRYEVTKIAL